MRYDKDYAIFAIHFDWYNFVPYVGYVPTDKAPKEAREAMERYNEEHYKNAS